MSGGSIFFNQNAIISKYVTDPFFENEFLLML